MRSTGQIYLNVKGREGRGSGAREQKALARRSPRRSSPRRTARCVVDGVRRGGHLQGEPAREAGPDIQLAFVDGWQTSRRTSLGGIPLKQFEDNDKKWSGEHSSSDAKDTQGILVSNEGDLGPDPSIADIGPTALSLLGVAVPPTFEGKVLGKQ
jgi:hypothetical protein